MTASTTGLFVCLFIPVIVLIVILVVQGNTQKANRDKRDAAKLQYDQALTMLNATGVWG